VRCSHLAYDVKRVDAATLARDAARLAERYRAVEAWPIDLIHRRRTSRSWSGSRAGSDRLPHMFWDAKIVCDHCNKKVAKAKSTYWRSARFCSAECRQSWDAANPSPRATGSEAQLHQELAIMIDAALVAYTQYSGQQPPAEVAARMVLKALDLGMLANVTAIERAERIADAIMQFQTNVLRCAPLLRGLGRASDADIIYAVDLTEVAGQGLPSQLVAPLLHLMHRVRVELPT